MTVTLLSVILLILLFLFSMFAVELATQMRAADHPAEGKLREYRMWGRGSAAAPSVSSSTQGHAVGEQQRQQHPGGAG